MAALIDDALWDLVAPLLPAPGPRPKGGRPRLSDRAALGGILYVLQAGIAWERLPKEEGFGSGMTCWRRLREWQRAGVWRQVERILASRLDGFADIDWARAWADLARPDNIAGDRFHAQDTVQPPAA